jgi:hypothetical protein
VIIVAASLGELAVRDFSRQQGSGFDAERADTTCGFAASGRCLEDM